jgi:hypothetical protein
LLFCSTLLVELARPVGRFFLFRGAPLLCRLISLPDALLLNNAALLDRVLPFRGPPLLDRAGVFRASGGAILCSVKRSRGRPLGRTDARRHGFSAGPGRFRAAVDLR